MGNYSGANTWQNNVYQFELSDLLQGGPNGVDNVPLKQLADRTTWLYERVGLTSRLVGELTLTANATLDDTIGGKLISGVKSSGGVLDITLPLSSGLRPNTLLPVIATETDGVINIRMSGADTVSGETVIHMHNNETLILASVSGGYKILDATGNFFCIGEEVKARRVIGNALVLNGQLIDRLTKPRLWKFAQSLGSFQLISDSAWNASGDNKGFFSTGNGSTTFRLPDERGLFERMADNTRAIGSFQSDQMAAHTHIVTYIIENPAISRPEKLWTPEMKQISQKFGTDPIDHDYIYYPTSSTGSTDNETRPKNIAKFNLIKY